MTIAQADRVDGLGIDKQAAELVLIISDHLAWDDVPTHVGALEAKLAAYVAYVGAGHHEAAVPESKGMPFCISLVCEHPPTAEANAILATVSEQLKGLGIRFLQSELPLSRRSEMVRALKSSRTLTDEATRRARYERRPLLRLMELYVLLAIGKLPDRESRLLNEMAPKLQKLYGGDGTWQAAIEAAVHLGPQVQDEIRGMWQRNLALTREKEVELLPQTFAEMFVDANFPID
jgi:hypothetical protein